MVKNNEKDKVIDEDLINTWKIVIFKSQGYLSCYKMKLQLSVTLYAPYNSRNRKNYLITNLEKSMIVGGKCNSVIYKTNLFTT